MRKIAVFYYSQSGQAKEVAKSIFSDKNLNNSNLNIIYKEIKSIQKYPFPWSKDQFFGVFAECRLGTPPSGIEHIDFSDISDAEIVIVVGQPWFLSPSLPLQSFFKDNEVRNFLSKRDVVFISVCRNMWLNTKGRVGEYIRSAGANFVGHIVLQDQSPNLISVITIVRWLINGKKEGTKFLPLAGVSKRDIEQSSRFGKIIFNYLDGDSSNSLQDMLLSEGAIDYKPSIIFLERTGYRIFGLWAKFVVRGGEFGSSERRWREGLFYYYLLFILFCLSPFVQFFYFITLPFRDLKSLKSKDCSLN